MSISLTSVLEIGCFLVYDLLCSIDSVSYDSSRLYPNILEMLSNLDQMPLNVSVWFYYLLRYGSVSEQYKMQSTSLRIDQSIINHILYPCNDCQSYLYWVYK